MDIDSYENFCSHQYVSRETFQKFVIFSNTLIKWQRSINLVSESSIKNLWTRHILDSAQLYKFTKNIKGNIIDFGSGAGLPGLILAMMGNKNIIAIDSDFKKCSFIREVSIVSNTRIKIVNNRIEDTDFLKPELIISRALAPLNKLIYHVENHMKKDLKNSHKFPNLLFLKGKTYKSEMLHLKKKRYFDCQLYKSLTNDYGKILYIKKVKSIRK